MRRIVFVTLIMALFSIHAAPLKIGIQPYDPPFSMQINKNHQFTGFEAQLMAEVCTRLKTDCEYIPLTLSDFFPQLLAHSIDLAIGQISITLEREKQFLFSMPYFLSNGQFIALINSPIKKISDIQDKTIGIFKGSLYKTYLLQLVNHQADIVELSDSPSAFEALINGDVDVLLLDTIDEVYWIANSSHQPNEFRFIGDPIPLGNGYGILAHVESTPLISKVNKALMDMESDGSYLRIYNLYFGSINETYSVNKK